MKKMNNPWIGLLLILIFSSSFATSDKGDHSLDIFIPVLKPGLEINVSALYLQPVVNNLGWSVTTTVLPIPSPNWSVNVVKPDFNAGFNLGAHYYFLSPGSDIQLNWSHLNTNDNDRISVNPSSQWISPFSQTGTPPTSSGQII